jgi:hypothetical protein
MTDTGCSRALTGTTLNGSESSMLNKIYVHFLFKSVTADIVFEDLGWLVHVLGCLGFWLYIDMFI